MAVAAGDLARSRQAASSRLLPEGTDMEATFEPDWTLRECRAELMRDGGGVAVALVASDRSLGYVSLHPYADRTLKTDSFRYAACLLTLPVKPLTLKKDTPARWPLGTMTMSTPVLSYLLAFAVTSPLSVLF